MSNSDDIILNSIDYHQYALFLFSSNHSSIVYNEGINNKYGITQINCADNIFDENSFKITSYSRAIGEDSGDYDYQEVLIDFTNVLVLCFLVFFVFVFFYEKIL